MLTITEEVAEEVTKWQTRDLEALYPVIYLDAIIVRNSRWRAPAQHIAA
nr:transposase [Gordonia phthalatica]